jgi:hypothetical protein
MLRQALTPYAQKIACLSAAGCTALFSSSPISKPFSQSAGQMCAVKFGHFNYKEFFDTNVIAIKHQPIN